MSNYNITQKKVCYDAFFTEDGVEHLSEKKAIEHIIREERRQEFRNFKVDFENNYWKSKIYVLFKHIKLTTVRCMGADVSKKYPIDELWSSLVYHGFAQFPLERIIRKGHFDDSDENDYDLMFGFYGAFFDFENSTFDTKELILAGLPLEYLFELNRITPEIWKENYLLTVVNKRGTPEYLIKTKATNKEKYYYHSSYVPKTIKSLNLTLHKIYEDKDTIVYSENKED